ncbi:MAG: hypothetical protein ACXAC8_05390 [Candidatus Hodarchaeales archaeon]
MKFQTYQELTINSKHLDLQNMINQDQCRIDLAAINHIDASIHFFEAENQIHTHHPSMYRQFCDYCYLLCPDEQFDVLDGTTKSQQLTWAEDIGIGILTISKKGELRVRLQARQQSLRSEVREEVIRVMNNRFRIRFSTIPLWKRTRNKQTETKA